MLILPWKLKCYEHKREMIGPYMNKVGDYNRWGRISYIWTKKWYQKTNYKNIYELYKFSIDNSNYKFMIAYHKGWKNLNEYSDNEMAQLFYEAKK